MNEPINASPAIKAEMRVFNTLTREKERFVPLEEGKVKIYACGPTVYNFFHLGNARPFIIFDLLRRFLEYIGYQVTFVQNFTDIDDKVIARANAEGVGYRELADRYIDEYFTDARGLGIRAASAHPRATDSMDAIIAMVSTLVEKGYCYVAEDGVYYEPRKFSGYGKLSHMPLDELAVDGGARQTKSEQKRNPEDFAVWKFAKPGEPSWESPWGAGRPGWHIECSAMSEKHLGETIDIHCGGQDLIFPHHENEIAQSEAAHGCTFARYWMHNGFINVDNEKMAKSKGNFFTVRDSAARFPYEVLRFFMLTGHYRSPINFSDALLEAAASGLERIKTALKNLDFALRSEAGAGGAAETPESEAAARELREALARTRTRFVEALADDLNTPDALAVLFDLVYYINRYLAAEARPDKALLTEAAELAQELGAVLGFDFAGEEAVPAAVMEKVEARSAAKKARDFALADALRAEVLALGYKIEDRPNGPQVSKL